MNPRRHSIADPLTCAAHSNVPLMHTSSQDAATCIETDPGNWLKQEMKKRLRDVDIK